MRAKIRGVEIYFDVDGMGFVPDGPQMTERPVLFLLHGGPGGDHVNFKSQLGGLRDTVQMVYVDHRGSGRSGDCPLESCTLDNNVEDVEALRAHLGLERICVLGNSYGGMVALTYAIRYPQRVSNLILSATAASYRFMQDAWEIVQQKGNADQQRVCRTLFDATFSADEELYEFYRVMGPMYATSFDQAKFEYTWRRSVRNFRQTNFGFGGFLKQYDVIDQLATITCPTLVLAGAHDWICPPQHSRLIAEKIPRAQLKVFARSSHSIAADENEAYLAALRGFLTYANP